MSLFAPYIGEYALLQYIVGFATNNSGTGQILQLFTNTATPDQTVTIGWFTTPTSTTGYSPQTLSYAGWNTAGWTQNSLGIWSAQYSSQVTFSFTASTWVYGYYVTSSGGSLLWCEQFSGGGGFQMPSSGGTVAIQPIITLS